MGFSERYEPIKQTPGPPLCKLPYPGRTFKIIQRIDCDRHDCESYLEAEVITTVSTLLDFCCTYGWKEQYNGGGQLEWNCEKCVPKVRKEFDENWKEIELRK